MKVGEVKRHRIEIPHGTKSGYSHWNCRCEKCNDVNNEYMRLRYASLVLRKTGKPVKKYCIREGVENG